MIQLLGAVSFLYMKIKWHIATLSRTMCWREQVVIGSWRTSTLRWSVERTVQELGSGIREFQRSSFWAGVAPAQEFDGTELRQQAACTGSWRLLLCWRRFESPLLSRSFCCTICWEALRTPDLAMLVDGRSPSPILQIVYISSQTGLDRGITLRSGLSPMVEFARNTPWETI